MTPTVAAGPESVPTYGAPAPKPVPGASDATGFDLARHRARRVPVITDTGVAATGAPHRVAERMTPFGIEAHVFDGAHVEPTDAGLRQAVDHAPAPGPWDAFAAVDGGSSMDFHPADHPAREPMVPHGTAVPLTAPEAFRFTFTAQSERHIGAARLLKGDVPAPMEGAMKQQRLLSTAPRAVIEDDIAGISDRSLSSW